MSVDYHNQIPQDEGYIQVVNRNCVVAYSRFGTPVADANRDPSWSINDWSIRQYIITGKNSGDWRTVATVISTLPEVIQRKIVHAILRELT